MQTGILGGTFNPPHNGHLAAAKCAKEELGLDEVLFIPTNIPPHKIFPINSATTMQRCEMVRLMTAPYTWASCLDIEVQRGGPSYTIDTLRALYACGKTALTLILGTDMFLSFEQWKEPEQIVQMARLAVLARDGNMQALEKQAAALHQKFGAEIHILHGTVLEISSTQLRTAGDFFRFTPPAVAEYIHENRLYQQA